MKKKLFSTVFLTTAFFASAVLAQTTSKTQSDQSTTVEAFDQPIELQLGGYMTWYGTYSNQRRTTNVGTISAPLEIGEYNNVDLLGDAEIYFSGSTTLQNGVKIGAMVQLEAGTDSDTSDQTIDETYMTVDSTIGRIILGNVKNVSNQMAVTSPTVSTLGLQETDFRRIIVPPTGFSYNKATYALLDNISTKLSYITPTYSGFTFGVSLIPGNKTKGKDSDNMLNSKGGRKLFKYGADTIALYQGDFGKFNVEASAAYTVYKPNLRANGIPDQEKNINEYGAGLNIGIGNWTVGGSYHYTNMSRETAVFLNDFENMAKGESWDFGVKFSAGPYAVSANVLQSRANSLTVADKKDVYSIYQLSGQYKILAGVNAFMDVAYVDFDSASDDRSLSNKGPAVAVGVNLTF